MFAGRSLTRPGAVGLAGALLKAHHVVAGAARVGGAVAEQPPRQRHAAQLRLRQLLALALWNTRKLVEKLTQVKNMAYIGI